MSGKRKHSTDKYRSPKLARIDLSLPRPYVNLLKLIRANNSIPTQEWLRSQIIIAINLELSSTPGFFWLRPASRVYRVRYIERNGEQVPVPSTIASSMGGERVWIRSIVPDWPVGEQDWTIANRDKHTAIACDLSSEHGLNLRDVLVAAVDVLPHGNVWETGLGLAMERRAREKKRRDVQNMRRSNMSSDPFQWPLPPKPGEPGAAEPIDYEG